MGNGPGFGANLYHLYKAGEVELPDIASRYLGMTLSLHYAGTNVASQAGAAGNPPALTGLEEVMDDLHHALGTTCLSTRDCGRVLSQIAKDYVRTDDDAVEAFNQRIKTTTDVDFTAPTPQVPDPPQVDDPMPTVLPPTDPPTLDDWTPPDTPDVELPADTEGSDIPDYAD